MKLLKSKATGVVSPFTKDQFKDLQDHPELLAMFDVIQDEPMPPEVADKKAKHATEPKQGDQ